MQRAGTVMPPVVATPEQRVHIEMAKYFQEEVADGETNALEWWRGNKSRFPMMAKMALKYLCIPATSTIYPRTELFCLHIILFITAYYLLEI